MLSVIVPAFNAEKTLPACIESLKKQDYKKPYEIIIVDDGSSDNTSKIARCLKVAVIKQKNSGPAKARNTGARRAKGSILLFTDADCVADKMWVSEMVKPFNDTRIVGVQGRYKTEQRKIVPIIEQAEIEQRYNVMKKNKYIDFIGSYSAAYRKKEFLKFGGFDKSFPAASGEDPELSFRIGKAGYKMVFNPEAIVYHTHPESLWKYLRTKYYRGYWGSLLYKKHPDKRKDNSYKSRSFFYGVSLTCLLSVLFLVLLPISLFASMVMFIMLAGVILFEAAYFMIKNTKLIVISPFVVFLRNIFIGAGILMGFVKMRGKK